MTKAKKVSKINKALIALLVVWCSQPATAGNKTQVALNGLGKVEASVSYSTPLNLNQAKQPLPNGVLSTTSVATPAAGSFAVRPTGFPITGNVTTTGLPEKTPSSVYCTVTSQFLPGGYKAVVRGYTTAGAILDNDELDLKIPIIPAACAEYDATGEIIQFTGTTGELQLTGFGTAGTAIWLRALLYTGPPLAEGESPSRDDLILFGILKGELVVAGPYSYDSDCPAIVPISGDMTKIYFLVDTLAKSEPYTLSCQNVSFGCLGGDLEYPAPTLTGGCETDAEAIVRYSIAPEDLPLGVPTQVTATAKALLSDGITVDEDSVLATCTFTATRNGLVFDGFYSPLNFKTPLLCDHPFKPKELIQKGQKIPIKFKTLCGSTSVTGTPPTYKITSCSNSSFLLTGNFVLVAGEWHAQFDTTIIGVVPGVYILEVILQDGTSQKLALKVKG